MRTYCIFSLLFGLLFSHAVAAGIVMTGTRIVYPAQAREKSVQLRNADDRPYIVELQVDSGISSAADDRFIITPPVFRMEPKSGQSVRLTYGGEALAQDRESLFYLSFTQLPAIRANEQNGNQLILAITNRVKIFYRPQGLDGTPEKIAAGLEFSLRGKKLRVSNSSGMFAVVRRASLIANGREILLADSQMVAPKSTVDWQPATSLSTLRGARLRLVLVNDYGADVVIERSL